ncbi:MAG: LysE family translocator [Piscinibacter sp.]|nr:LysE family translocator [Piscinibacter sp.]
MQTEQIIAFFVFAVVAAVTPGPSVVMVMVAGARAGIVGGLKCLAGVVVGMALMMGAANLGLGGLVQTLPGLLVLLRGAGAVFLLWLAWTVASAPPLGDLGASPPVGFWPAVAFQWINPKSWIVCISAASTYGMAIGGEPALRATTMAAVFSLAAAPSCAVWLVFGTLLRQWLTDARRSRIFNVAMGSALALSVVLVIG